MAFGITTMASRLGSVINFLGSASLEEVYIYKNIYIYIFKIFMASRLGSVINFLGSASLEVYIYINIYLYNIYI